MAPSTAGARVISFSLWGHDPKYTTGAIRNARLAREIYSGWQCRFSAGSCVPENVLQELTSLGCAVIRMGVPGTWAGLFWRFQAFADAPSEIMIFRDTDSRLNGRERAAVDQWIASGKLFHIMRDHPRHETRMLGGMWGVRSGAHAALAGILRQAPAEARYGDDQRFLRSFVYPIARLDCLVHDEFFDYEPDGLRT